MAAKNSEQALLENGLIDLKPVPNSQPTGRPQPTPKTADTAKPAPKFDPNFTQNVINAIGPNATPRARQVFASLIHHIHDFARENEVTVDEWMQGIELLNASGRLSTPARNEGLLLSDILGASSLVDTITSHLTSTAPNAPTSSAILGPFWRPNAPHYPMNTSIVHDIPNGDHALMYGTVTDSSTGEPIEGAELEIWHTAPNGLYEQQDDNQVDMNLRGRFTTANDGRYSFYCLRPTSYPIPTDGPAGKLLLLLDRHPMRPAHIHAIVSAPNHRPLITQVFDRRDQHLTNDAVFAVKDSLIVDFLPRQGDERAQFELEYDFKLAAYEA